MALATKVVIVHVVDVVPDEVRAGPQDEDEEAEDAGVALLLGASLTSHLGQLGFSAERA